MTILLCPWCLEEGVKEPLMGYPHRDYVMCPKHGDKSMVEVIEKDAGKNGG